MTKYRTDRTDATTPTLKLICTLPLTLYTTRGIPQFRVDGHFKSVQNNRRRL